MRVSVVIPVLDAEAYLAPTIRSVLNQTMPPGEVIVVDNGSTDRSPEIARAFDPAVRLLSCEVPGAAAARARGAEVASGAAVMFLDADDLLGPTALQHLSAALAKVPGGVALCPWRRYEWRGAGWIAAPASCAPRRADHDDLAAWLTGWYHPPCSVLWSREALARAGGWDPAVSVDDDGDLMMRALSAGVPVARTEGGLAYYRKHPGDAPTLSGRAATRAGLSSRRRVLAGVERRLRGSGTLRRYAAPLAEAFDTLARDAEGVDPEMRAEAALRARAHGGDGGLRRARRRALQALARRGERGPRTETWFPPPGRADGAPIGADTTVSIVVPTHNRETQLRRAIASVMAQTHTDWELIVVDDASTDETTAMVSGLGDPRIRLLGHEANAGVAAARNTGMAQARGAFIAFLDSDDSWMPDKLGKQVALMRSRSPLVGLVYCGLITRRNDGFGPEWRPTARGNVLPDLLAGNVVHLGTSGVMIRREVVDAVGGFDEDMPANEDHDYWTRVARFFAFDAVPEPLVVYDQTGGAAAPDKRSMNFAANMRARDAFVTRHGIEAARLGMRHRYQMDSAARHLEWDEGMTGTGRRLLLKAIRDRPLRPAPWVLMALSVLPRRTRRDVAGWMRSARARS